MDLTLDRVPVHAKSATVAGILGILLGVIGAHDWYLGNSKKGSLHVKLALLGAALGILGNWLSTASISANIPILAVLCGIIAYIGYVAVIGSALWGLIDGVVLLVKGDLGLAAKGYHLKKPLPTPKVTLPESKDESTDNAAPSAPTDEATTPDIPTTPTI